MAAKFGFFLTLVVHVLLLLYTSRLRVIPSTSDQLPLIDRAQEKLDNMTLSMRKLGYGLSASILQANLKRFIHECGFMRSNITIFAPRDEAMNTNYEFRPEAMNIKHLFRHSVPGQIITWRIEEEDFQSDRIVKGAHLFPACERMFIVNVTEHPKYDPGRMSINKARVLHWNIYQDELVAVHGVDTFFDRNYYYHGFHEHNYLLPWILPWERPNALFSGLSFDLVYGNQSI